MITCDDFFAELGDYLEGLLSPEVRKDLALHMSECRACHVLFDSTCKTVKIVTESSSFDLPQSVFDPIIERVIRKLRTDRA
jgi:anti-sigma factor RsiW